MVNVTLNAATSPTNTLTLAITPPEVEWNGGTGVTDVRLAEFMLMLLLDMVDKLAVSTSTITEMIFEDNGAKVAVGENEVTSFVSISATIDNAEIAAAGFGVASGIS